MECFKIKIRLTSSVLTPFHSDTLWGHICWALRYLNGEMELESFLKSHSNGEPLLIISNAFPKGYLPYPVLPPIGKEKAKALIDRFWKADDFVLGVSVLKSLLKTPYLSREVFIRRVEEDISNEFFMGLILEDRNICPIIADYLPDACPNKYDESGKIACGFISSSKNKCPPKYKAQFKNNRIEEAVTYHSKINRLSGTTIEKSLFTTEDTFFGNEEFEAYCKIGTGFSLKKLTCCLEFINNYGYGKKKSSGKGNIKCTIENGDPGISITEANAFMTLSNYVPKTGDPTNGYYRVLTKYGKLGGHFASSPITNEGNPMPFKYPLIMFEAGSVFISNEKTMNYGRIVNGMHAIRNPDIAHYGIAYPLLLKVKV